MKLGNIEWFAVVAWVVAVLSVVGFFMDWINYEEAIVLLLGAVVTAVISLRSR